MARPRKALFPGANIQIVISSVSVHRVIKSQITPILRTPTHCMAYIACSTVVTICDAETPVLHVLGHGKILRTGPAPAIQSRDHLVGTGSSDLLAPNILPIVTPRPDGPAPAADTSNGAFMTRRAGTAVTTGHGVW